MINTLAGMATWISAASWLSYMMSNQYLTVTNSAWLPDFTEDKQQLFLYEMYQAQRVFP